MGLGEPFCFFNKIVQTFLAVSSCQHNSFTIFISVLWYFQFFLINRRKISYCLLLNSLDSCAILHFSMCSLVLSLINFFWPIPIWCFWWPLKWIWTKSLGNVDFKLFSLTIILCPFFVAFYLSLCHLLYIEVILILDSLIWWSFPLLSLDFDESWERNSTRIWNLIKVKMTAGISCFSPLFCQKEKEKKGPRKSWVTHLYTVNWGQSWNQRLTLQNIFFLLILSLSLMSALVNLEWEWWILYFG